MGLTNYLLCKIWHTHTVSKAPNLPRYPSNPAKQQQKSWNFATADSISQWRLHAFFKSFFSCKTKKKKKITPSKKKKKNQQKNRLFFPHCGYPQHFSYPPPFTDTGVCQPFRGHRVEIHTWPLFTCGAGIWHSPVLPRSVKPSILWGHHWHLKLYLILLCATGHITSHMRMVQGIVWRWGEMNCQ